MTTCARRAPERRVDLWGVVVCVCVCRREGGAVCLLDEAADGEAGGVELERRGRASADIALWLRRLEPHAEQQLVLLRAAEVAVAHAVAARVDARLAEVSSRRLHAAQHLEGLEDDEAGDDGVGGGDGVDDPPRDPLDLPPRLERDVEGCAAQVGGGSHKVHRVIVILAQGRGRSRAWAAGGLRRESGEWRVEREGEGEGGALSKASEPTSDARWVKIRSTEARSTAALSSTDHARCSSRAVAAASGSASFASSTLTGGLRFSHRTCQRSCQRYKPPEAKEASGSRGRAEARSSRGVPPC